MRKMTINEQRNVNGGRWRCNGCGHKTLFAVSMSNHIIAQHIYKGHGIQSYSWCW